MSPSTSQTPTASPWGEPPGPLSSPLAPQAPRTCEVARCLTGVGSPWATDWRREVIHAGVVAGDDLGDHGSRSRGDLGRQAADPARRAGPRGAPVGLRRSAD